VAAVTTEVVVHTEVRVVGGCTEIEATTQMEETLAIRMDGTLGGKEEEAEDRVVIISVLREVVAVDGVEIMAVAVTIMDGMTMADAMITAEMSTEDVMTTEDVTVNPAHPFPAIKLNMPTMDSVSCPMDTPTLRSLSIMQSSC